MTLTPVLSTRKLGVRYGSKLVVNEVDFDIYENKVTAIIGPSGCGKSTVLRCFNRMNDFVPSFSSVGDYYYRGRLVSDIDTLELRTKVGMVFQKPNPFPKSIAQNITWGPKIHHSNENMSELVEDSLKKVGLWDEVKDRLHHSAMALSGGQQQRLCIARTIAMKPDVILMDEPCSALDPKSTLRVEELIHQLKKDYTIVIVTHNMQQAARVSDFTAFFYEGSLVEYDDTQKIFSNPEHQQTDDYIRGRFG